jgi:hypothetical protein
MDAVTYQPAVQQQQHFIVLKINLFFGPTIESKRRCWLWPYPLSNGIFLKAILGRDFDVGRLLQ